MFNATDGDEKQQNAGEILLLKAPSNAHLISSAQRPDIPILPRTLQRDIAAHIT